MSTSKKPASSAGRALSNPSSTRAQRRVAASDLAQAPRKASGSKKKGKKGK